MQLPAETVTGHRSAVIGQPALAGKTGAAVTDAVGPQCLRAGWASPHSRWLAQAPLGLSQHQSAADRFGVAGTTLVRVVHADLAPGLAALEPGQGVRPHRDGDALHSDHERPEAAATVRADGPLRDARKR